MHRIRHFSQSLCVACIFTVAIILLVSPNHASANDSIFEFVIESIDYNSAAEKEAPHLQIYIDGKLRGLVPGIVGVPITDDGISVEIGVPQLTIVPLYSFIINEDTLDNLNVDMTITNLKRASAESTAFWEEISIYSSYEENVDILFSDNTYKVVIPSPPYDELRGAWSSKKINPTTESWYGEGIKLAEAEHPELYAHWKPAQGVQDVPQKKFSYGWSGAIAHMGYEITEKAIWEIDTRPSEARVIGRRGDLGITTVKRKLPVAANEYVILRKEGFQQIVYECIGKQGCDEVEECRRWAVGEINHLSCEFR